MKNNKQAITGYLIKPLFEQLTQEELKSALFNSKPVKLELILNSINYGVSDENYLDTLFMKENVFDEIESILKDRETISYEDFKELIKDLGYKYNSKDTENNEKQ